MAKDRKGNIKVTRESETGRNERFRDLDTGRSMDIKEFNKAINNRTYNNFYTREINGIETPVSKPDKNKNNNLG